MTTVPGYVVSDRGDAVEMLITGRWSRQAHEAFVSNGATRLVLNYALGFDEPTLDFMRDLPIRELVVLDRRLTSLDPIYALAPTLQSLRLTTDPGLIVDLSKLPDLIELAADWGQIDQSIAAGERLRKAFLRHYGHADLSPIARLSQLVEINLKDRPRLRGLDGLTELSQLRRLGVFLARELEDLGPLQGATMLEELELEGCRRLSRLDPLGECVGLRTLNLSECGDLESARPLRSLADLEYLYLYGSTKIVDGDLTPIASLPRLRELRMQARPHYRPAVKDIQEGLPRGLE